MVCMQLPQGLARFNRHVTNPIQRMWAGWAPTMGILEHVGRKSGKPYRVGIRQYQNLRNIKPGFPSDARGWHPTGNPRRRREAPYLRHRDVAVEELFC